MSLEKRSYTVKKSLGGANQYRTWEDYELNDTVVGKFVGIHICQYKKENYKIQVVDADFANSDLATSLVGKTLVLNNMGSLNSQMKEVNEGDIVRVVYNGMNTLTKGPYAGKNAHSVSVDVVELEEENGL